MRVQVVSFRCVLKNNLGHFISSSFNQEVVTNQEANETPMLPEFIEALRVLKNGERQKISISAERAYGFYQQNLVAQVSRKKITNGSHLEMGDIVTGAFAGDGVTRPYHVIACTSTNVMLDANHPLAGQDLVFDVEMVSSHEETDEPILSSNVRSNVGLLC
jgi:FKBP-type peptidyl-prolyl cis-trans isomerase SlyD